MLRTDILDEKIIGLADRLKIIARYEVGFDNIDTEAAAAKEIYVSHTPAANINSVAEHVTGLILAISRQTVKVDTAIRQGNFGVRDAAYGMKLKGKMLEQADFISLHLPYDKALHHFINQEKLGLMKPTAFLINAARGGLVDEVALTEALNNKSIVGAALDVFEQEPVPAGYSLLKLDNLIVTPHLATLTKEAMSTMSLDCAKEIVRVKNQQEPLVWLNM